MASAKQQSGVRKQLVSNEILERAAALFAERGFAATNLQDVADALDMSRTALYHYIGGKDELLATLVHGLTDDTAESLERLAADQSLDPLTKMTKALHGMVLARANNPARIRLLLGSEGSLKEPLATEFREARRRSLDGMSRIVEEGVRAGAFRPVESHVAAFALFGMCNWVAWWYRPDRDGRQTPEMIADALVEIGMKGLCADSHRAASDGNSVQSALARLREDLAFLERATGVLQPSTGE
jgi:AcrR family transcriptional regulator